ncbi:MAG: diadenosine tetraphosphate (Ap4A) HIT family hydrolase [Arenicella sp.]|jgi:diadenosine tetraphosphate (Ap4A) HIT family hydrolase
MFSLDSQLVADTIQIGDLPLSRVLLINNSELPWVILVPRRVDISEWHSLEPHDQLQLHLESIGLSKLLMGLFNGDKLNTGAIGNLVSQLHVHHVVRFKDDSVWPQPVWGKIKTCVYSDIDRDKIIDQLQLALAQGFSGFVAYKGGA